MVEYIIIMTMRVWEERFLQIEHLISMPDPNPNPATIGMQKTLILSDTFTLKMRDCPHRFVITLKDKTQYSIV